MLKSTSVTLFLCCIYYQFNLNPYNQRKQRLSLVIATVCYVHWGVKTVLKYTIYQNKTRASDKCWIRTDKQRVGGGDRMAKTEPPGRASVATEPESLFYFCGPAKLAMEASEHHSLDVSVGQHSPRIAI